MSRVCTFLRESYHYRRAEGSQLVDRLYFVYPAANVHVKTEGLMYLWAKLLNMWLSYTIKRGHLVFGYRESTDRSVW